MAKADATLKPAKPSDDFPLFAHATGQWAKKIKGKMYYFGPWADPEAALMAFTNRRAGIEAGIDGKRKPAAQPREAELTMAGLANHFLNSKRRLMENQELSPRMFHDYYTHAETLLEFFGKSKPVAELRSDDFDRLRSTLAKGVGLVTLANRIRLTRVIVKFAYDADLVEKPIKVGPSFKAPSKKLMRAHKQSRPALLFSPDELRKIIDSAGVQLRAMILLGANGAFGQTDCSTLPKSAVDLDGGWITFPRPKTAIRRRIPLWPETVEALRVAIAKRPTAKRPEFDDRVFLTRCGVPWVRSGITGAVIDGVAQQFGKLLTTLDMAGNRRGFYSLRRGLETIGGDGTRDQPAIDALMGHAAESDDMGAVYRQSISDERLLAVTNHIRGWLWPETIAKPVKKSAKKPKPEPAAV